MCTWDMLESPAEWFYAAEYISLVFLAFCDLRSQIIVVLSNYYIHLSVSLVITPLRLPDYRK